MPPIKPVRNRAPAPPLRPVYRTAPPETVDPAWILKALAAMFAFGLLCAYVTLCLVFTTHQWQFVLHPSRSVPQTPASLQLSFAPVRFGDDSSGQPQLAGWWIPGDVPTDPTVLMLHGENGSMSDALPAVKAFHDARLNVLLFDYRGYGESGGQHPTESLMRGDATAAFKFLTSDKHIPPAQILVYGAGLGASLAVRLCGDHPEVPGLILSDADGDTLTRVEADQRSRVMPIGLLFHERFPLADALHTLRTPKLLLSFTRGHAPVEAERAADPKITVELPSGSGPDAVAAAVRRFLGSYIQTPPSTLR